MGAAALVTPLWAFSQAGRMHDYRYSCLLPSWVFRCWFSGWQQIPSSVLGWKGKVSWGWFLEVQFLGVGGRPRLPKFRI